MSEYPRSEFREYPEGTWARIRLTPTDDWVPVGTVCISHSEDGQHWTELQPGQVAPEGHQVRREVTRGGDPGPVQVGFRNPETPAPPQRRDILDAIDEATGCQQCGAPLAEDGASPDFCGVDCQRAWHEQFGQPLAWSPDAAQVVPGYDAMRFGRPEPAVERRMFTDDDPSSPTYGTTMPWPALRRDRVRWGMDSYVFTPGGTADPRIQIQAGPPEQYTETTLGMSNFDHEIDEGFEDALRSTPVYGRHSGLNFNGLVWFQDGVFHEQIWRHREPVGICYAESLDALMRTVNDSHGWA